MEGNVNIAVKIIEINMQASTNVLPEIAGVLIYVYFNYKTSITQGFKELCCF